MWPGDNFYFTSDSHFSDGSLIRKGVRKFSSKEEMNEELARKWNAVVPPGATVFHLGDFGYGKDFPKLNGVIHLIRGNHDNRVMINSLEKTHCIGSVSQEMTIYSRKRYFLLSHIPQENFSTRERADFHIHGHLHGDSSHRFDEFRWTFDDDHLLDVGVDCAWTDFAPISADKVFDIFSKRGATL